MPVSASLACCLVPPHSVRRYNLRREEDRRSKHNVRSTRDASKSPRGVAPPLGTMGAVAPRRLTREASTLSDNGFAVELVHMRATCGTGHASAHATRFQRCSLSRPGCGRLSQFQAVAFGGRRLSGSRPTLPQQAQCPTLGHRANRRERSAPLTTRQ